MCVFYYYAIRRIALNTVEVFFVSLCFVLLLVEQAEVLTEG